MQAEIEQQEEDHMTIYDIAKKAGVSASTVSRVINHKPGIRESTRKRVQELLDESGYTPDISARGLVTQSSRFIGILIEDIRVSHHTESVYVIEQEMTCHGYTCITFSTGADPCQKAKYIEILEQRRVQGVILIGSMFGADKVQDAVRRHLPKVPVVIVNGMLDLPNAYSVLIGEERGTEDCVALLLRKNRCHLAYLMDVPTPANLHKLQGFCTAMQQSGLGDGKTHTVYAPGSDTNPIASIARGRAAANEILQKMPDTDGILCSTDALAIGCLKELQSRRIRVPEDIALIGVDNSVYGLVCSPTLSTLDNKLAEVSLSSARLLLDAFEQKALSHKLMLFTEIIEREST